MSNSSPPYSSSTINNRQYDYSNNIPFSTILSLFKLGFKLVPLDINHEHDVDWSPIYNNPDYWHPNSFNDPTVSSRFVNVASALGKTHLKDIDNKNLYIQVLDTEFEYNYAVVTTPLSQLITKSNTIKDYIYNLLKSVGETNDESHLSNLTLLEFCKRHTYVTKTKKENG